MNRSDTIRIKKAMLKVTNWSRHNDQVHDFFRRVVFGKLWTRDPLEYIKRLDHFLRSEIRYIPDPVGVELIQDPLKTWQRRSGDCDDFTVFAKAALESIGIQTRILFAKTAPRAPRDFSHVYLEAWDKQRGRWWAVDCISPKLSFPHAPQQIGSPESFPGIAGAKEDAMLIKMAEDGGKVAAMLDPSGISAAIYFVDKTFLGGAIGKATGKVIDNLTGVSKRAEKRADDDATKAWQKALKQLKKAEKDAVTIADYDLILEAAIATSKAIKRTEDGKVGKWAVKKIIPKMEVWLRDVPPSLNTEQLNNLQIWLADEARVISAGKKGGNKNRIKFWEKVGRPMGMESIRLRRQVLASSTRAMSVTSALEKNYAGLPGWGWGAIAGTLLILSLPKLRGF